jgi:hypothetical protein
MEIQLKALTVENLDAFRNLLGSSEFGGCFCAVWTSFGEDWQKRCSDRSQPNYFQTAKDLESGRQVGYLVYSGKQLVGWTGSGPKTSFPLLKTKLGSRLSTFSNKAWSIGCLAVASEFRVKNLSEKIVCAVLREAQERGAKVVEAYPVRPFDEARIYRGSYQLFQRLGFKEIGSEKDGAFDILLLEYSLNKIDR